MAGRLDAVFKLFHRSQPRVGPPLFAGPIPPRRSPLSSDAPAEEIALDWAAVEIDPHIGSGGLFPVSLLTRSNASKFATEAHFTHRDSQLGLEK